jgi:hypothetical protein
MIASRRDAANARQPRPPKLLARAGWNDQRAAVVGHGAKWSLRLLGALQRPGEPNRHVGARPLDGERRSGGGLKRAGKEQTQQQ